MQGSTPVQTGPETIIVTRRYIPVWALVFAAIGFFFFLFGLLFLLVRSTETLEIRISPGPDGSTSIVAVRGMTDSEMLTRLQGLLMGGQPMAAMGPLAIRQSGSGIVLSPDGNSWWDGNGWQATAQTAPPDAPRSPDNQQWWDGTRWHRLPAA
jgi:hypothetical protein